MLRHYFKTALRSLLKRKLYTAINIFGLAVGLALCLLVAGHIIHELSFEDFHANKDRTYRLEGRYEFGDESWSSAQVQGPLGPAIAAQLPEVEKAAVFRVWSINSIGVDGERMRIIDEYAGACYAHGNKLIFADANYFDVFSFALLEGDPKTALNRPNTVLLSEQAAQDYFPAQEAVGRVIKINDKFDCEVVGILENMPQNTQLYTDFIVSYSTLERIGRDTRSWDEFGTDYAYLLLNENTAAEDVEYKISGVVRSHMPKEDAAKYSYNLQSLRDIYFNVYGAGKRGELSPAGEASLIYSVGMVALFILILAIANFINLSTARSADRAREVGVRKVFGANRAHLVRQYLGESILIALFAMFISVALYEIVKRMAQSSLPRQMLADFYHDPLMVLAVIGLVIVVGVLAGFYPALYLSRFRPMTVLQGKNSIRSSKSLLRRVLVVFQFAIAVVFIFCTTIIMRQTNFITSINLGFDTENIMVLDFDGETPAEDCALLKDEILNSNRVLATTATNCPPGRESYTFYGYFTTDQRRKEDRLVTKSFFVDHDFISTFGLEIVQGRGFSGETAGDDRHALIVNESAVEALNTDNPVGMKLYGSGDRFYEIIGVVKNFHGQKLGTVYEAATVLRIGPQECTSLAVKLPADDISGSIAGIKNTWEAVIKDAGFDYTFLAAEIDASYEEYRSQGKVSLVLAILAIAIACLGIFGLVSYTAEQRTKEIGIRKVLGASVTNLVGLLSREFVILLIIANLIALPIGYLMMGNYLKWFPYKVGIGLGTYLLVGGLAIFFALTTASFQSIKAALANPADSLRSE